MELLESPLERERRHDAPLLPHQLEDLSSLAPILEEDCLCDSTAAEELQKLFPLTSKRKLVTFKSGHTYPQTIPLHIGVVFSGGQAPGGHNVIAGIFDALKKLHPKSVLIGFLGGPKGVVKDHAIEIDEEKLSLYRNQGGFDLLGSGRDKIESEEDLKYAQRTLSLRQLDGLVIIGGDDSHTNAAFLAEYLLKNQQPCQVVGVPKTIDGDLKNTYLETSFGFDTAAKVYAQIVGSLARDALSAGKYYFFVKIMGRSASHLALEVALQTHPNLLLVGEEIAAQGWTLAQTVDEIVDLICERSLCYKDHGVILIPEGIIEFIKDFKVLVQEINRLLSSSHIYEEVFKIQANNGKIHYVADQLSAEARECFELLPEETQIQLLLERDPHGNVQVSKIETERLFIALVTKELKKREDYKGKFSAQPYFCGYEGRSTFPSLFDASYCYALGHVATMLVRYKATGYMASLHSLTRSIKHWEAYGVPIVPMMHLEERKGKMKAVVKKSLVDLEGIPFRVYQSAAVCWRLEDRYRYPGPIQYAGPMEISLRPTLTLMLEGSGAPEEDVHKASTAFKM